MSGQKKNIKVALVFLASIAILLLTLYFEYVRKGPDSKTSLDNKVVNSQVVSTTSVDDDKTLDDCSQEIPVEWVDDVSLDLDGAATMYWLDPDSGEYITKRFPFAPKSDFLGCSESVRLELRGLDSVARESYGDEYNQRFHKE
jgi:hypothetical protein